MSAYRNSGPASKLGGGHSEVAFWDTPKSQASSVTNLVFHYENKLISIEIKSASQICWPSIVYILLYNRFLPYLTKCEKVF